MQCIRRMDTEKISAVFSP